jgi:hypothetical protein
LSRADPTMDDYLERLRIAMRAAEQRAAGRTQEPKAAEDVR